MKRLRLPCVLVAFSMSCSTVIRLHAVQVSPSCTRHFNAYSLASPNKGDDNPGWLNTDRVAAVLLLFALLHQARILQLR